MFIILNNNNLKHLVEIAWLVFILSVGIGIVPSLAAGQNIILSDNVTVRELKPNIWLYTAYYDLPNLKHCPANGLIIINKNKAMLINLPWTDKQAGVIFDWVINKHQAKIEAVIPTHAHIDCIGGLAEAHRLGAISYAFNSTIEFRKKENQVVPLIGFSKNTSLYCGNLKVELAYPGSGHTLDNIVAWIPDNQILFAGCLVKSMDAKDLGNTTDSDLKNYPKTLENLMRNYANAEIVIPGHGQPSGVELIRHTIELCNNRNH